MGLYYAETTGTAQKLQDQLILNVSCEKILKNRAKTLHLHEISLSDETDTARQIETAIIHDMY